MTNGEQECWRKRAEQLEKHGVPPRRAEVVALIEAGKTHSEVKEILGLNYRSNVGTHIGKYADQWENLEWLLENAPTPDALSD